LQDFAGPSTIYVTNLKPPSHIDRDFEQFREKIRKRWDNDNYMITRWGNHCQSFRYPAKKYEFFAD
jgi:hypothetical protein